MEKHIYIFGTEDNICKIGVSGNIKQRKSSIANMGNNKIINIYYTPKCFNAYEIENGMHKYFAEYRKIGEWFNIDFEIACKKLDEMFGNYAVTEIDEPDVKICNYHSDLNITDKIINIQLSNTIIDNLDFNDIEFCTYVALMKILSPLRNTQFVSYNMIAYELFGGNCKRAAQEKIKSGLDSLIRRNLVSVVNKISNTEFELDMHKLFFDENDAVNFTVLKSDEVNKLMSIDDKTDKFKLLRYFTICLRTLKDIDTSNGKHVFIGSSTQEQLCEKINTSYKTNAKLIRQYNDILESNNLIYIYRSDALKMNKTTKQIKSFSNYYGRYSAREDIIQYASNIEKTCYQNEEILDGSKSNYKRSISAKYNNLCRDFNKYLIQYSDKELIEIYKQIHNDNLLIRNKIKELHPQETSEYYDRLVSRIRDEDIFKNIPCVMEYINSDWGEAAM